MTNCSSNWSLALESVQSSLRILISESEKKKTEKAAVDACIALTMCFQSCTYLVNVNNSKGDAIIPTLQMWKFRPR